MIIGIDMGRARLVAHERRRALREAEFAPLDHQVVVALADPERLQAAEGRRQAVRKRFAEMQSKIDQAETPAQLIAIVAP